MSKWAQYLELGWKLTELRPGSKAPRHDAWQKEGAPFDPTCWGAGLVHQWSGTCALDIDDIDKAAAWLKTHGIEMADLFAAPDAVQIVSGRENHGKLLYALPEALPSKKIIEDKRNILDFRCIGGQDVLPPTIHPDTRKPYAWLNYEPLLGLPRMPAALEALWRSLVRPATERPAAPEIPAGATPEQIQSYLAGKDPDCSRDEWIAVGQVLHSVTNGMGFFHWDNWARRGQKYELPEENGTLTGSALLMSKWRGFRAAGGRGLNTLLSERVAAPDEFPVEATVDEFTGEEDPTMIGQAHVMLRTRLVYMTRQERWWPTPYSPPVFDLDRNEPDMMTADGVRNVFTRHMPVIETKMRVYHLDPIDLWRKIKNPRVVYGVGFLPGGEQIYDDPNDGRRYVNSYKPYHVESVQPTSADREAWAFLLSRIESDHYRRWIQQFFAYLLRNPGRRIEAAPLLFGTSGTGKTTLLEQIPGLLFGKANIEPMSNDTLKSQFNDQVANSWFLLMDELKMGKLDRIETSNKVKAWITGDTIAVHPKGGKPYKISNRLQILATSNYSNAAHLENHDRRWAVCEMKGPGFTDAECADLYEGFLNTDNAAGKLKYLMEEVKLEGFSPTGRPPDTAGRKAMIVAGLGQWESRLSDLVISRTAPFDKDILRLEDVRDCLIGSNAPPILRIVMMLKEAGIDTVALRNSKGDRLHAWRHMDRWKLAGYAAAFKYLADGIRPFPGTDEVPLAFRAMAGDDSEPDDLTELLGAVDG